MSRTSQFKFVLSLVLSLLSNPSQALLNGSTVKSRSQSPFVGFSQLAGIEISDCSGVFVSSNTLLTAAHCFDDLADKCSTLQSCQHTGRNVFYLQRAKNLYLQIGQSEPVNTYVLIRHPLYQSKNYSSSSQIHQSNFDLAIVIISKNEINHPYLPVAKTAPSKRSSLWSYGAGMSELKLFAEPKTQAVYNLEDGPGTLKRAPFSVKPSSNGELLHAQTVLVGQPIDRTNFSMKPVTGGQILGSDSGGALVQSGKVFAITRNYELSFTTEDLGLVQKGLKNSFVMHGKSTFTSLHTQKNRQFLLSVKKYGGNVYFN